MFKVRKITVELRLNDNSSNVIFLTLNTFCRLGLEVGIYIQSLKNNVVGAVSTEGRSIATQWKTPVQSQQNNARAKAEWSLL